jgi:hypothetical protein
VLEFDFDEVPGGIPKLNSDWRREDQEQAVLSMCSSLITIAHDGESRVVQFSHFSVKEFLTSERLTAAVGDISFHHILLEPAHTILAQACLGVLLRLDDSPRETSVERFPLAEYAAEHWVDHALFEGVSFRIKDGMDNLFDLDKPHFFRWIRIHDIDDPWGLGYGRMNPRRLEAAPVYYAALCGFPDLVDRLIGEHPEHLSAMVGAWGTALHAASRRNHVNVGQTLLKHGANLNALDQRWERTPLHVASECGHLEFGRWLLEHGAEVNATQVNNWTPLHLAALDGHFGFVRTLLRHDADVNAQNDVGYTPLHLALTNGHFNIARFLLDNGANSEARGKYQSTPLHLASYRGNLEVVHMLLEHGVDVGAEDDKGNTAYQMALNRGHDEVAQLLSGQSVENKA